MFTGIIESKSLVTNTDLSPAKELTLHLKTNFTDLSLGESIAVNGVCLTVTEYNASGECCFFLSSETLNRSSLAQLKTGVFVNCERALTLDKKLSGHLVQGHVDGVAKFVSATEKGESFDLIFEIPEKLSRYCIEKGSITLDGISLTINSIEGALLSVRIIPHTWTHTNLSQLKPNDLVNMEVDVIAKYVEKLCQPYLKH